jgi:hypothetical protein
VTSADVHKPEVLEQVYSVDNTTHRVLEEKLRKPRDIRQLIFSSENNTSPAALANMLTEVSKYISKPEEKVLAHLFLYF